MKRRDMIKSLGLTLALPFLPWDIKGKAIEKPGVPMPGKSITINHPGKYLLNVSVVFKDLGSYSTAKGFILIKRKNKKTPELVTLFIRKGGKEPTTLSCYGNEILDLNKNDLVTVHMKPKHINVKICYISCNYVK